MLQQVADRKLKISVLGHSTCGKRAFVERLVHGTYTESCAPMMGTDVSILRTNHGGGHTMWLFWVHAGNENFRRISINTIVNSDAVILCVDPTEEMDIVKWVEEMRQDIIHRVAAPIFVVFTKFDERGSNAKLQALPDQLQGIHYLAITSAKNNTGFKGLLDTLYSQIQQYKRPNVTRYLLSNERTPLLYRYDEEPAESEGCCSLQ